MSGKKRVFSGIQPTGDPHIGNYIGAMRNWVADQDEYDSLFCVVDQHAITADYDPAVLRANVRELVGLLLAVGLDPERCSLFVQSHVAEHTELAWLLTCVTPMGWLGRMTQYKEKSEGQREQVSAGMFAYPALMAADILLYQTDAVPVGDDQKQHVELSRDLAQRFNNIYGDVFTVPQPIIRPVGARIMGLDDPTRKMSKSETGQYHLIGLLDEPDRIRKKLARAVTDSQKEIVFDPQRPGVYNLLTIYRALSGRSQEDLETHFEGKGYGDLKKELADVVISALEPVQARYREVTEDASYIDELLEEHATRVRAIAASTMSRVREVMGLR